MLARDQVNAALEVPAILNPDVLAVVLAYPDELLISWFMLNAYAHDALTQRERTHALGLIAGPGQAEAATYVRERLRSGDHVAAGAAQRFDVGAAIVLDRLRYTVTGRRGRNIALRGERGGLVDLCPPLNAGGIWTAWHGGVLAPSTKHRAYRRAADGAFTRVP